MNMEKIIPLLTKSNNYTAIMDLTLLKIRDIEQEIQRIDSKIDQARFSIPNNSI